jgi:hypothetical protein
MTWRAFKLSWSLAFGTLCGLGSAYAFSDTLVDLERWCRRRVRG